MSLPVLLSGRALHTGVPSAVRIARRPDDGAGLRFFFPGFPAPLVARDLATLTRSARRATVLTHPSGAVVRTPEHLLAAALFFADVPLDASCDAEEPPGLDGSAAPWFDAFAEAAQVAEGAAASGRCREYDSGLTWTYTGREGRIEAAPAPSFSVEYLLTRGDVRQRFRLESIADAPAAVLPARTFIFRKDWNALRTSDRAEDGPLLVGADESSGLLLAESPEDFAEARATHPESAGNAFPLVHPRTMRFPEEAARHKVLDLLGDLALNGLALPRLRLSIVNGGHALNHLLLNELAGEHRGRNPGANPP